MKTECPRCKQHYEVDDSYLGVVVTCESCNQDFVVENKSSFDEKETVIDAETDEPASSKNHSVPYLIFGLVSSFITVVCIIILIMTLKGKSSLSFINEQLNSDIDKLKQQNNELKMQLDDLMYGPEALLANALGAYEASDFENAKNLICQIFERHPGKRMIKHYLDAYDKITLAYDKMKEDQAAEAARIQSEKTKKEAEALANIKKRYDIMQEVTWYETYRNCKYEISHNTYLIVTPDKYYSIEPYFGLTDKGTFILRLRTRYYDATDDRDWVFYEKVQIKGDNDVNIYVETKYPEKKSDTSSVSLTEWSDNNVDGLADRFIQLSKANSIRVKFYGKYSREFDMTEEQLKAFQEIMHLYESMRSSK